MKRIIIYFSIAIITLPFISSCSKDFITSTQYGTQDLDNYFNTLEESSSFVDGLYKGFSHWEDWWQNYLRLTNEMSTDDAWMGNIVQDPSGNYPFAFYTISPSNDPGALYNFYYFKYQNINSANIAIAKIPGSSISEADKNVLIGQAKFFRAYSYWELVQNFGDVVLYTNPLTTSELSVQRAPKSEVYQQIIADLKDAALKLPVKWTGNNVGRVTSYACKALLARTYLFMQDYKNAYCICRYRY